MKGKEVLLGLGLVFLALAGYSRYLGMQRDARQYELAAQTLVLEGRQDTRFSLQTDCERAKKLSGEIEAELSDEDTKFRLLQQTLSNIQERMRGTEELKLAVSELREEYEGLKSDLSEIEGLRR